VNRRRSIFGIVAALLTVAPDSSLAQEVSQCEVSHVIASDAMPNSKLGASAAIVGDLMVGGANLDDAEAENAGAAYVYERVGGIWVESQKLVASDASAEAHFGTSVATDGVRVVVGASGAADAGADSGKAYVYRYDGAAWFEEARLTAGALSSSGAKFGGCVAIDGGRILVTAHLDDTDGVAAGSVFAFRYDGANWVDAGRVSPSDFAGGKQFGSSVAIDGTRAVVGAISDDEARDDAGAAYVIKWTGSAWTEVTKLVAPDATSFDSLGHAVALEGTLLLVASPVANDNDGAVYVYEHDGVDWQLAQTLRRQISIQERFGSAIGIDNGVIAVGEELGDGHLGVGWIFKRIGGTYQPTEILRPSIRFGHDWGGRAIDISGDTVALGTEGQDQDFVGRDTGAVWFFETSSDDCDGNDTTDRCEVNSDCNDNGVFDRCEPDCDDNGIADSCDIASGSLADCGANGVPDVCEPDCNGNGTPDDCDLLNGGDTDCNANAIPDECDLDAGAIADCNGNGVLDACDIIDGTSADADGDCVPDECDVTAAPLEELNGQEKSRFISFSTAGAGCRDVAVRVMLTSLKPPGKGGDFAAVEGTPRWVGPPMLKIDQTADGPFANWMASLQCLPHVRDWGTVGLMHAYGPAVMPESTYSVSFYDVACGDVDDPSCYSQALTVNTGKWGDLTEPFAGGAIVQPDINDVSALVQKFLGGATPARPVADLHPNLLNLDIAIDFRDITTAVNAYLAAPYPFEGPAACP